MFLISKLLGLLLNPMLWILLLMAGALLAKRPARRKRLLWVSLLTACLFSNGWIVKNLVAAYSAKPSPLKHGESYQAGILLSGMAAYDKRTDWPFFTQDADRFIQMLGLYKKGHVEKVIIVGGNGNPFDENDFMEAEFLAARFKEMGVPEEDVLWDSRSRNTIENVRDCRRMIDSMTLKGPFVLVTSAYHMPRSTWIFRKKGIEVRPFPANHIAKPSGDRFTWRSLIPSTNAIDLWRILLHEWTGMVYARVSMG